MNHETTIRHTDGRLYLIEWIHAADNSPLITSVYTEPGECLSSEHYLALKASLIASRNSPLGHRQDVTPIEKSDKKVAIKKLSIIQEGETQ